MLMTVLEKIRDECVLLESVQETTSEYTSRKNLTDKMEAVKKTVEEVTKVLRKVHRSKYKYVAYQACKTLNRMVKVLCGRIRRRWSEPIEFCKQSRGVNVEASEELQVDVTEVSDDETSEKNTLTKPELRRKRKIPDSAATEVEIPPKEIPETTPTKNVLSVSVLETLSEHKILKSMTQR